MRLPNVLPIPRFSLAFALCSACGARSELLVPHTATDGSAATDAVAEVVSHAAAPRLVAPISTMHTLSRRPTVRWTLPANVTGAHVEFCSDRACENVLESIDADGTSVAPTQDLPAGAVFWRVRGLDAEGVGSDTSATWEMFVPRASHPRDGAWGSSMDLDGDGATDIVVGAMALGMSDPACVFVYDGSPAGPSAQPAITLVSSDRFFGAWFASAGDLDGDGFGDLAVMTEVATYVYRGSAHGIGRVPDLRINTPRWPAEAIAPVGDLDGDGYADLAAVFTADDGVVHFDIHRGSAHLPPVRADWHLTSASNGEAVSNRYGFFDADGDGRGDIAVVTYNMSMSVYSGLDRRSAPRVARVAAPSQDTVFGF